MPDTKAPTKAEAVQSVFAELGVDTPVKRVREALAAKGVTVSENYVYDLKKTYRKRGGGATAAKPAKAAAHKTAPKAPAAKPATAPVVEAVQTAQHLLELVGKADALRLLEMLAAR
jgi:hypothetical protein